MFALVSSSIITSEGKEMKNTRGIRGRQLFLFVMFMYSIVIVHTSRTNTSALDAATLATINDVWFKEVASLEIPAIVAVDELPAIMSTCNILCVVLVAF